MKSASAARALALLTFVCLVLVAAGFFAGRFLTLLPFQRLIATWRMGERVDGVVENPADRDALAAAYLDPERARRELAGYSWMPLNAMAPFVGHLLMHGTSANATINVAGCRAKEQLVPQKGEGVFRILMTGGSVLYGSGAPSDETTIPALLRAELQKSERFAGKRLELFAFAVPGWSTTHERIAIENLIVDLQPDLVVSFSGLNDIQWSANGQNVLWMRSYSDQHWYELVNAVLGACGQRPLASLEMPEPVGIAPERVADRLLRNVDLAAHVLERARVPYVFVLQPAVQLTKKSLAQREKKWVTHEPKPGYTAACAAAIRSRLAGIGGTFRFVDLTPIFDALLAEVEIFVDSVHFGDRGNLAVAKALAGLLP